MAKYFFKNDYSEGAHPRILEYLQKTNSVQQEGYGLDEYSLKAAELVRKEIKLPGADVHFLTGGTQTNLTFISAVLRPHHAVLAAETAHINVHETGAIEATGHKIFQIPTDNGKITVEQLQQALEFHEDEHFVKPKLVFISNATELGTVYTASELERLYDFCLQNNLYLYLDGARLANAIVASEGQLSLEQVARNTDAFYIGGTKNGALLGEALVITNPNLKEDFRFMMKQRGALLAKGRVVGLQFLALFENGLYYDLARNANAQAQKLKNALENYNVEFLTDSPTNQIFPILPNDLIEKLYRKFDFYIWKKVDQKHSAVRLVTSWFTQDEPVESFIAELKNFFEVL